MDNDNSKNMNRYEKVVLAAHRARNLEFGAIPMINTGNKKIKNTLVAIMEIEANKLDLQTLRKAAINQEDNSLKITEVVSKELSHNTKDSTFKNTSTHLSENSNKHKALTNILYEDEEDIS